MTDRRFTLVMQFGANALILAATGGHLSVVKYLVSAGADINSREAYGATALLSAAKNGFDRVAEVLIQAGSDVNVTDQGGLTALIRCAFKNHHKSVFLLVRRDGSDTKDKIRCDGV